MKVLLILLLGVHAFWACSAATTNAPLSDDVAQRCEEYCSRRVEQLSLHADKAKELETKVTELEAKLATLNESKVEYEERIELKKDLFDDLHHKLDAMQNKVRGILQINSRNKTESVVEHAE